MEGLFDNVNADVTVALERQSLIYLGGTIVISGLILILVTAFFRAQTG